MQLIKPTAETNRMPFRLHAQKRFIIDEITWRTHPDDAQKRSELKHDLGRVPTIKQIKTRLIEVLGAADDLFEFEPIAPGVTACDILHAK